MEEAPDRALAPVLDLLQSLGAEPSLGAQTPPQSAAATPSSPPPTRPTG
jgi:hypothetical protein